MVPQSKRVLVTGAGGFIGHHLVSFLKAQGHWVRAVDLKHPEFCATTADEFEIADLRRWEDCLHATRSVDIVYSLAADMGGMGYISSNHARILHNNSLINLHTSRGRSSEWCAPISIHLVCLRLSRISATVHRCCSPARSRGISR